MERTNWNDVLRSPGQCLTPEDFEAMTASTAEPSRLAAMQSHVESCAACRTELAMFREFTEGTERPNEAQQVDWIEQELIRSRRPAASPAKQPWWHAITGLLTPRFASVAFASVLLVAVGVYVHNQREPDLDAKTPSDTVLRSGRIEAVGPLGDIASAPEALSWKPVPGAARYHVRILEVDRNPLLDTESEGASLPINPQMRAKFTPGKTLLWEVSALNAAGKTLAQSGLQSFRVSHEPLSH